jgi:hypothetical protein
MRRVLDNRYAEAVVVAQVALLPPALRYTFDLLDFFNLETTFFAEVALDQKGNEYGPF